MCSSALVWISILSSLDDVLVSVGGTKHRFPPPPPPPHQAFSSSLSGTLATQASLRGAGVGDQEATVAAATITWLLRGEFPPPACNHVGITTCGQQQQQQRACAGFCCRWNRDAGSDRLRLVERVPSSPPPAPLFLLLPAHHVAFVFLRTKLDSEAKKWR